MHRAIRGLTLAVGAAVSAAGRNVLIVDDDPDVIESLDELLRGQGYEVTAARDGLEALAQLSSRTTPFALILLDWLLPRVSGAEVMAHLVDDPEHAGTAVVVLTGHDRIVSTRGVAAVITKPVHARTLLLVVDRLASNAPRPMPPADSVPVHVPIERRARLRSRTISMRRPR
jgi:CheY-like chemotaxis protein